MPRGIYARPSLEERFWAKVDQTGRCWVWTSARYPNGYGAVTVDGETCLAHRVAYELEVGPIPEGLDIDHLCRNRLCVNPDHLEPVTRQENLLRGGTIPALNAAKTHCPHGHEYTPENTYTYKGARQCRACWVRRRTQRKEKVAA